MWGTVLALALVAGVDPGRIGVTLLVFSRRRPVLHLAALWLGGLAVGVALGVGALFGLHDVALRAMHRVERATAGPTAGQVQIAAGALALVVAAGLAIGVPGRRPAGTPAADPPPSRPPGQGFSRLSARTLDALRAGPPWITFVAGMVLTTDFRYLGALTVILASGTALGSQVGAAAAYTLVGLAFAEIPLLCHLVAPHRTRALMGRAHDWVAARRSAVLGVVVAALGVFLIATGLGHV
ncbi:hypothetical protein BST11_21805 [Mycobacterium alsense]|uniref:GAP family protein n=1 Tax=Mycobacterium alsense TaxID=324058 RepID=A0AA41XPA7_9MYCO|nr:GAP family protein [Mycobacterium alsense]MCV7379996.1 GAP family protein [Mycobacterium alsense]OQZ88654.1 hypothetical protein BST11_21805 [Mycobacterium alsense]